MQETLAILFSAVRATLCEFDAGRVRRCSFDGLGNLTLLGIVRSELRENPRSTARSREGERAEVACAEPFLLLPSTDEFEAYYTKGDTKCL